MQEERIVTQHPVKGVDHVFLLVEDLDRSRDQFARLGFTVSPRGLHSAHKGTANHTIMFEHDYLELLGIVAETEANASRRAMIEKGGEGLYAVACRIDDAARAERELKALGVGVGEPSDFQRPVPRPDGSEGVAAFSTLMFEPSEVPIGISFMCQHRTREMVWLPELLDHPNGAVALAGLVASTDDPDATAAGFARLFAAGRVDPIDGGARVATGSIPLDLLRLEALASRYPAFDVGATAQGGWAAMQIAVRDTTATRTTLQNAGIAVVETLEGIAVAPAEASGTIVEFVRA